MERDVLRNDGIPFGPMGSKGEELLQAISKAEEEATIEDLQKEPFPVFPHEQEGLQDG